MEILSALWSRGSGRQHLPDQGRQGRCRLGGLDGLECLQSRYPPSPQIICKDVPRRYSLKFPADLCPLSQDRLSAREDESFVDQEWYYYLLQVVDPLTLATSIDIPSGVKFEYDDLVQANRNRYEQVYDPEDMEHEYVGGHFSEDIVTTGEYMILIGTCIREELHYSKIARTSEQCGFVLHRPMVRYSKWSGLHATLG